MKPKAWVTLCLIGGLAVAAIALTYTKREPETGETRERARGLPTEDEDHVAIEASDRWLPQLSTPRETVFRREIVSKTATDDGDLRVRTLGRLPQELEKGVTRNFREQSASHQRQSEAMNTRVPLTSCDAMEAAEAMVMAERMKIAALLVESGQYATVVADSQPPPEVTTHDRVTHGDLWMRGQQVKVVVYVPHDDLAYRESFAWLKNIAETFWEEYIQDFNQRPYDERRKRISDHDAARDELRRLRKDHNPQAVADKKRREEVLKAMLIDWRVEIDRATCTLSRR